MENESFDWNRVVQAFHGAFEKTFATSKKVKYWLIFPETEKLIIITTVLHRLISIVFRSICESSMVLVHDGQV